MEYRSLYDALAGHSGGDHRVSYVLGEDDVHHVSSAELYDRALGTLKHLQDAGAGKGDHLITFLNDNQQFVDLFWACICGGIVPVPIAVGVSDEHKHKLFRIARQMGRVFLGTNKDTADRLEIFADVNQIGNEFRQLRARTVLIDQLDDLSVPGEAQPPDADDIALIQYSSGSTSDPKGVVLTHRNLLCNIYDVHQASRLTRSDSFISWMPMTHDMGLIGVHLTHFVFGVDQFLMQTDLFIRRPMLWLLEASRHQATLTVSPNFGYKHCLKAFRPGKAAGLDLSHMRIVYNGAEPISARLCEDFLTTLAPFGLKRTAMLPTYGLAEASICVTMPDPESEYESIRVRRDALGVGDSVCEVAADSADVVNLVSVGKAIPHCEVRITDASDATLADDVVGHIQIRGGNVTAGYFNNPQANAKIMLEDGWLDTGDLGFLRQGNLFVSGRIKEIVFVNGQNYYPHDLESIVQDIKGLELGKVAVSGYRPKGGQTDELIVFVLHRGGVEDFVVKANEVTRAINEHAGVEVAHVVPVNRIPKTTSGKIQRLQLAGEYSGGKFAKVVAELEALREREHGHEDHDLSDTEKKLKALFDEALPDKKFGVDDNLFEIGTSSLELMQIHEQIEGVYPGKIDVTELFDLPTIASIAAHLEAQQNSR